jgi:hypothetical protein
MKNIARGAILAAMALAFLSAPGEGLACGFSTCRLGCEPASCCHQSGVNCTKVPNSLPVWLGVCDSFGFKSAGGNCGSYTENNPLDPDFCPIFPCPCGNPLSGQVCSGSPPCASPNSNDSSTSSSPQCRRPEGAKATEASGAAVNAKDATPGEEPAQAGKAQGIAPVGRTPQDKKPSQGADRPKQTPADEVRQ